MVFELIPFIACTSAVGALGTGAWYVAMKEYQPSDAQRPSHEELIGSAQLEKNRFVANSSSENPSSSVSNVFGVGIDFVRTTNGQFFVSAILSGVDNHKISVGDVLLQIDGKDPTGWPMVELRRNLFGTEGSKVVLDLRSSSGRMLTAILGRNVPESHGASFVRGSYAPVPNFTPRSAQDSLPPQVSGYI